MLEKIKVLVEIISLLAVALVFIVLVIQPIHLKNWCERGGFNECKFFGSKFIPTAEQQLAFQSAEQELGDAQSNLMRASEMIKQLTGELSSAGRDSKLIAEAKVLVAAIETATNKTDKSLEQLNSVVTELAPIGIWGVVFGGDKTLSSAKDELSQLVNFNTAGIFLRNGYFRTVVRYDSRQNAESNLPLIKDLSTRNDSYLVNMNNWCPVQLDQYDGNDRYIECSLP